ncbi:MAG: CPBP family intramembrane metalloprotease [Mycobacterium sp.]|nr:CPBP family intramembrane metalloprotease [Mycobacterium sp.]
MTINRRTWLRIAQFPPLRLAVFGVVMFYMLGYSNKFIGETAGNPLLQIAVVIGWSAVGFAVYIGLVRLVERRPVAELALPGIGRELGTGILIGAGLYTACILLLMVMGIYKIDGLNPVSYLLPALALPLSSGIFEELLFRGVLFRIVEEWLGSWISLAVSSLVFGLVHLMNPAATVMGAVFISVEAGVLLAAAYMLTRRLWMSMGFHIAWNYTQSGVFSGIVSGGYVEPGLIKPVIDGPTLLTGGGFGVESSVIAFMLCTVTGAALLVLAKRRGHIVPPFWKRNADPAKSEEGTSR